MFACFTAFIVASIIPSFHYMLLMFLPRILQSLGSSFLHSAQCKDLKNRKIIGFYWDAAVTVPGYKCAFHNYTTEFDIVVFPSSEVQPYNRALMVGYRAIVSQRGRLKGHYRNGRYEWKTCSRSLLYSNCIKQLSALCCNQSTTVIIHFFLLLTINFIAIKTMSLSASLS